MNNSNVIKMPKRFDYSSNGYFSDAFAQALTSSLNKDKIISLDCMDMDYVDSAGIGMLAIAHKKAKAVDARMIIINLTSRSEEILMLANLQKIIEIK